MVDCSHGNSQKKHENQLIAAASVAKQVGGGSHAIVGVMIESNINAGNQKWNPRVLLTSKSPSAKHPATPNLATFLKARDSRSKRRSK